VTPQGRDEAAAGVVPPRYVVAREAAPTGAVIVLSEYWGLVEHIRDVARRVAGFGFLAVAPDLFDGATTDDPLEGRRLAGSLDHDEVADRIAATADLLRTEHGVSSVGVIGWCMGGGLAFKCARDGLDIQAAVGFYGRPGPVEGLAAATVPTLGIFAEEDHVVDTAEVRAAADVLRERSTPHRFVVAKAVRHGFYNDTRPEFDADSARLAEELLRMWLHEHLNRSPAR